MKTDETKCCCFKDDINSLIYKNINDEGLIVDDNIEGIIEDNIDKIDWKVLSMTPLSEDFIEKYANHLDWKLLSLQQDLSEDFIEKHAEEVDWEAISKCQIISEEFIVKHLDKIHLNGVLFHIQLSEDFLTKNEYKFCRDDWKTISSCQHLSIDFIERHKDVLDFHILVCNQYLTEKIIEDKMDCLSGSEIFGIATKQKLSEEFIEKYYSYFFKYAIHRLIMYQKLSEHFFDTHSDLMSYGVSTMYHRFSEDFLERHFDKINRLNGNNLVNYQKLSEDFIKRHKLLRTDDDNWLYKDVEFKKNEIMKLGLYDCYDDYFIAYKGIRSDRYSCYNFQYKYEIGGIYESNCDCTNEENSFGLSVWTEGMARDYCKELVIKVKVRYEDVGRVVHNGGKIRCFEFEVLS